MCYINGMALHHTIDDAKIGMVVGRDVPWLLRSTTTRFPDKTFLVWEPFDGEAASWTYAEFRAQTRRVAAGLSERGVRRGERVLVHLDNCPEFLLAWFACAELGVVAVSTNTGSVQRDVEYFAAHAEVVAAVTSPQYARLVTESAPDLGLLVVTDNDGGAPATTDVEHVPFADLSATDAAPPERDADPMEPLGIQFTSGTTSRPKAVLWTHANAVFGAETNVSHMRLQAEDSTLIFLPLFHTNAQSYSMLSTLWTGGTVVLQPRFSASRFWDVSIRNQVTWCSTIPFCMKAVLGQPIPESHPYRFWGTAVVVPELTDALGIDTVGWWGMTETITHGIVTAPEHPGARMSIGRPSTAFDIAVRRPDGTPIGPGERGELFIRGVRGVQLFQEYFGNEEATAAAFDDDGWFATGDLIAMDETGEMFFSDRSKDMLKVGGENVAASEVEAVILETGLVSEVAVVGQPHEMLDEVPVAFVIPGPNAGDDLTDAILAACRAQLADFKVPRAVHPVDDFPRSTLEKVAKNELRDSLPTISR